MEVELALELYNLAVPKQCSLGGQEVGFPGLAFQLQDTGLLQTPILAPRIGHGH